MAIINPLSISSFFTEIYFNDLKLGTATSFAYKYNSEKYLITNYHVAYGINPETKIILNSNGAVPNKLVIHYYDIDLKLYNLTIDIPDFENPFKFIEKNDVLIDLAVFKLNETFNGICINEIEEKIKWLKNEPDIVLQITEPLYVLGFPRGINIEYTPIWKRSSIASEPEIFPNGIPYFYIDTTTREGMSGAPVVFYTANGNYKLKSGSHVLAGGCAYNFVGVYSGRDRNDEPHIAQLGKVWNKTLIDLIIEQKF